MLFSQNYKKSPCQPNNHIKNRPGIDSADTPQTRRYDTNLLEEVSKKVSLAESLKKGLTQIPQIRRFFAD